MSLEAALAELNSGTPESRLAKRGRVNWLDEELPKVSVPEGAAGEWRVERFEIDEKGAAAFNFSCLTHAGMGRRCVEPGTYTRLAHGNVCVMSDTPAERLDHYWFMRDATGTVLVTGLGLGMVVQGLLLRQDVSKVVVVEFSPDVISLVGPHYLGRFGDRLEIIEHDARTWVPPAPRSKGMFQAAWHDIWTDMDQGNWPEMKAMKRHYQNWCLKQACWGESHIKWLNRQDYEDTRRYRW